MESGNSKQQPRILFVTPQPFFVERGSPYRVRATVRSLLALGYEVDILCYPFGRDLITPGLRVERCIRPPFVRSVPIGISWRKLYLDLFLFFKALWLVWTRQYSLIHGVEEAGVMAYVWSRLSGIPYIFDMHSQMSEQLSQCVIRPGGFLHRSLCRLERFCMQRAAGIMTVSDVISKRATEIAPGVPVATLEDLPLGGENSADVSRVEALRTRYELQGKRVAVYTGNFEPYQGIDLLLEAMAVLNQRVFEGEELRLLIVGGGDERHASCMDRVRRGNLASQVIFAGQQPEEDMAAFMALGDILVSPRIAGAHTPLKIYSYMAAERPIVATSIAAHTNVLDFENSFLAEPTPEGFAAAMVKALDPEVGAREHRARLVRRAAALLSKRFSQAEFRGRLDSLYRAALGEPVPSFEVNAKLVQHEHRDSVR